MLLGLVAICMLLVYVFSVEIYRFVLFMYSLILRKVGLSSKRVEFKMKRHTFLHSDSLVTKCYRWVNDQIICLGLKKYQISVSGYLTYWIFISIVIALILGIYLAMSIVFICLLVVGLFGLFLLMTRLRVTAVLEDRESAVMNAMDMLISNIENGVQNSIILYVDSISPSIRPDFILFLTNLNRGYTFNESMLMLSDSLGSVFRDFSQKAIFFEELGDKAMKDIFEDITQINRLRRELRFSNKIAFNSLRTSFAVSTAIVVVYAVFTTLTDPVAYSILLGSWYGSLLIILDLFIIVGVLGYITSIRSSEL